jgi:hypothetical protein
MRKILAILLIANLAALVSSQEPAKNEDEERTLSKLLKVPSATYKFTADNSGVAFCNLTRVAIKGFRPGCVEKKDDKFLILEKRNFEDAKIPGERKNRRLCRVSFVNHGGFPYGGECERGKLAVIEVALANGTVWKLVP